MRARCRRNKCGGQKRSLESPTQWLDHFSYSHTLAERVVTLDRSESMEEGDIPLQKAADAVHYVKSTTQST